MGKEQLENLIALFKEALEFYGNKENYEVNIPQNNELFSKIEMDQGTLARKTLEHLKNINEFDNEMQNVDNDELLKKMNMAEDSDDPKSLLDHIIQFNKKLKNND